MLTSSQVMLLVRGTTFSELLVYPPKILGMASLLYLVLVLVLTPVFASRVAFPNQVNVDLLFCQLHQAKNYYSQKPIKHTLYFSSQTGTLDIYACSGKRKKKKITSCSGFALVCWSSKVEAIPVYCC